MLTVNLFDALYSGEYSVLGKTPKYVQYVRNLTWFDGITIFTDAHVVNADVVQSVQSPIKIGWLREPQCLHPGAYEAAYKNKDLFDVVLTHYQPFLDQGDPFKFCPYGGVWLPRSEWGVLPKTRMISMLYGNKLSTEGHRLRHSIADFLVYQSQNSGIEFYGYRGEQVDYSWQTKLRVLGEYRFTIVTETCKADNLFTEILLDCFAVGTVPIFWGCPNLNEFFDERGVITFENARDVVDIVRGLDDELYQSKMEAIQNNLERVGNYEITEDWLFDNVLRELAEKT